MGNWERVAARETGPWPGWTDCTDCTRTRVWSGASSEDGTSVGSGSGLGDPLWGNLVLCLALVVPEGGCCGCGHGGQRLGWMNKVLWEGDPGGGIRCSSAQVLRCGGAWKHNGIVCRGKMQRRQRGNGGLTFVSVSRHVDLERYSTNVFSAHSLS